MCLSPGIISGMTNVTTTSEKQVLNLSENDSIHSKPTKWKRAFLGRRALQRLDLLLLVIESLDLNGSESMLWTSQQLGLEEQFPNRVELWKRRCYNPLRRTTRRGKLSFADSEALILLLCSMANRLYPLIRQLLSSREPMEANAKRWIILEQRLSTLLEGRMNPRRGAVQKIMNSDEIPAITRQLVFDLAIISGPGGVDRLRACLLDPIA